ncbi:MAG: hypothetical protein AB1349_03905 [Elusimicrobiota bacterium]
MALISLFLLGFVSLGYQILLLRELLVVFFDNELVIGIFIANWMLIVAVGSYITERGRVKIENADKLLKICVLLTAVITPSELLGIRVARHLTNKAPTEMLGLIPVFVISFLTVVVICFLFGSWFVLSAQIFRQRNSAGIVYAVETSGAVFGGFITNIILIKYLSAFQISLFFSALIFGFLIFASYKKFFLFWILVLLGIIFFHSETIDRFSFSQQWKPFEPVETKDSFYGRVTVLKAGDTDYDFYENSTKIYSTIPSVQNEEITHIPLALVPSCKNILLLGDANNEINELLKYKIIKIDYVISNPVFFEVLKKYSADFNSLNLKVHLADGRFFVKQITEKYDCIILNISPPLTGLANRYFTKEFFGELKKILSPDGILIFPLLSSENYMSDEQRFLSASVFNTVKSVFEYCETVPASYNYFLCAAKKIEIIPEILKRELQIQKITTKYLTPYYLDYILRKDRVEKLADWISSKKAFTGLNYDFQPLCYLYGLRYWLSYFNSRLVSFSPSITRWLVAVLFFSYIFLVLFFVKIKKLLFESALVVISFLAMVFELILIFAFQSVYGYIYYQIGLLFSLNLLGIGTGSYVGGKMFKQETRVKTIKNTMWFIILYSLILGSLFKIGMTIPLSVFYVLVFIAGLFVGLIFPLVTTKETIGKFYALDLLGALAGSISASLIFVPLIGTINTCFFVGLSLLLTILIIFVK